MRVDAIRHGDTFTIELCPADSKSFEAGFNEEDPVELIRSDIDNDILMRAAGQRVIAVRGATPSSQSHLERMLAANKARLIWIASARSKGTVAERILVQVHEFNGPQYVQELTVGVDERFVDSVRERIPESHSLEALTAWLSDVFLIEAKTGDDQLMLVQSTSERRKNSKDGPRAFRLLGTRWAVDVAPDSQGGLQATRLVSVRDAQTSSAKTPPVLLKGSFQFRDSTFATRFKSETSLDALVRDADSYLGVWQQYQRLETEAIVRRARTIGAIPYNSRYQLDNGNWQFSISKSFFESERSLEQLPLDEFELECVSRVPSLLDSGTKDDVLEALDDVGSGDTKRPFAGAVLSAHESELVFRPAGLDARMEEEPPASGHLVAGLRGDLVRLRRRRDAWERIRSQGCPMPHLGHLLEGRMISVPPRKRIAPITPEACSAFGGTPTSKQASALDIALNTPDIAVIQGPPGTGKTRVLGALQARLGELERGERLSGSVLLTGYQHTAVENAARTASTLGLPPIKIGSKRGGSGSADPVDSWARQQSELVRGALSGVPEPPMRQILRQVRMFGAAYQAQLPDRNEDGQLLREVIALVGTSISPGLRDELADQSARLQIASSPDSGSASEPDEDLLKLVRGLRYEKAAFEDDGPRSAHRVLTAPLLQDCLSEMSIAVLERARDWMEPDPISFLENLAGVRDVLLDELATTEKHLAVRRLNPELLRLLARVEQELAIKIESNPDGIADVLWDYLGTLESDMSSVRAAMERYTLVLAATCQHAVHKRTLEAKGSTHSGDLSFETVIVDEAARATPLDLLIPMALAERRIVLVGDHRQLPHLLEPDIERELSESMNEATSEAIRNSLFQRLFEHLKKLQAKDGALRTITLDQQFRMHPVLGDFVSRAFYGEDEQFTSPRPASDFAHGLSSVREGPAVWIDVPRVKGSERGGRSKARPCEARVIVDWVHRLGSERPDLSIGVIAFYGEQVREIEREAARCGLGQIDDFQGMEFDIVFLSMTRSNALRGQTEKEQRQKYGFLMLPNRLCVAMSRQRRLLAVVGDLSMCSEPGADTAIPGLVSFKELCDGSPGGLIDG